MSIEGRFINIWHTEHANPVHAAHQRNQTPGDVFGAVAIGKGARRAALIYQLNHFDMPHFEFSGSHSVALSTAGALLMLLAVGIWFSLAQVKHK
ncbi:hypothetical protein GA0061070_10593 [Kosakonia oryziphila]|uniref:Uncharacterized protein n=1 Tax=Kosakonia oryziphila TaxID=1005667 RepID=A0A1C4GA25_9ENTR|nr:hypothetical protein GA0061070_10593 [Kosakonia oryziphila]